MARDTPIDSAAAETDPLLEHARDEQEPAERREPRPTMSHESLLPVRDSDKPKP